MKAFLFVGLLVATTLAGGSSAQASMPADMSSWRAREATVIGHAQSCMQDVEALSPSGRSGCIRVTGPQAFPVAGRKFSRRGWGFTVAGSEAGDRRAVVMGFARPDPDQAPMMTTVANSLRWLGAGLDQPVTGVWPAELVDLQVDLAHALTVADFQDLDRYDILMVCTDELEGKQLDRLETWSRTPTARLLCFGDSGAWLTKKNGERTIQNRHDWRERMEQVAAFPGNRLIEAFGLQYIGFQLSGEFTCLSPDHWSLLQLPDWAQAMVIADEDIRSTLSGEDLKHLALGMVALQRQFDDPDEITQPVMDQVMATVNTSKDGKIHTEEQPWLNFCASLFCTFSQKLPPEKLQVPACVESFPGTVTTEERLGETVVPIDPSVPRWHSTGVYAVPGEVVTVTVPAAWVADGMTGVQVGCHTDSVRPRAPRLDRFPEITRYFPVAQATMEVACAFGGPIYIDIRKPREESDPQAVKITGGVAMPVYRVGDSLETWKTVREAPAPWAEFQANKLIITVPSSIARTLDNPDEIVSFWDKVVEVQDELCGYTERTSPERFAYDRQISMGWMHSGYPLMAFDKAAKDMFDLEKLNRVGNWGCFHEVGHNHQSLFGSYANAWTFDDNIEVTVNLFSAYTYIKVLGFETPSAHSYWNRENLVKNLGETFKPGTVYGEGSHRYRSLFFAHLAAEFGWDAIRTCLSSYWDLKPEDQPANDLEKRSLFLVRMSRAAGYNLVSMFGDWGLETTTEAQGQVADLPARPAYTYPLPVADKVAQQ